jgi:hypothetical protein
MSRGRVDSKFYSHSARLLPRHLFVEEQRDISISKLYPSVEHFPD